MAKVRKSCPGVSVSVPKEREHQEYTWMPIKVPEPPREIIPTILIDESIFGEMPLVKTMMKMKRHLLSDVCMSIRLKQVTAPSVSTNNVFKFAGTLSSVHITAFTEICFPPVINTVNASYVSRGASKELEDLFRQVNICHGSGDTEYIHHEQPGGGGAVNTFGVEAQTPDQINADRGSRSSSQRCRSASLGYRRASTDITRL